MNKTAIKNFAVWARNKLIADISYRAGLIGITESGIASALPQSTGTTEFYDIGTAEPYSISGDAVRQRRRLVELIERKEKETDYKTAYKYIIEEVAYTWFNRLIAIRFMEVNDYLPSHIRVLSSESGKMEPDLVTTPFDAGLNFSKEEEQIIIQLKQNNLLDELFRLLFIKQCNSLNEILPALFENTNDYSELLLSLSVIDREGIIYHLNNDIPEEDFNVERGGQVEIIGWLYQYYIAEPKDELINARKKYKKDDIPFVTQLFTSDWIVKYMVENSLGRMWMKGNPDCALNNKWEYYLEDEEVETIDKEEQMLAYNQYRNLEPEKIKVIDPCMGSGHILIYVFDVLMQIYESVGYSQRDAAKSILENNIYGLDIDDRAFQMAYFSVLMKARQYNRRVLSYGFKCNLQSIQESNLINKNHISFMGYGMKATDKSEAQKSLLELLDDFEDAKEYGSIIDIEERNWSLLSEFVNKIDNEGQLSFETFGIEETQRQLHDIIKAAKILSQKYEIVVTNPPYMNSSYMPDKLKQFVQNNYVDFKGDMFSVFTNKVVKLCKKNGHIGLLMPYVWMFISTYEKMRSWMSKNTTITSLVQLEYNAFEAACVPVAALTLVKNRNICAGEYVRLSEFRGAENQGPKTIEAVKNPKCGYRFTALQTKFEKIPGAPIAYWVNDSFVDIFSKKAIKDYGNTSKGIITGDNAKFLRLWHEVSLEKVSFDTKNYLECEKSDYMWYPCNKGGEFRKWYGNNDYIIDWWHNGAAVMQKGCKKVRNCQDYSNECKFIPSITWTSLSSSKSSFRYSCNALSESAGMTLFIGEENLYYSLAFLNSEVANFILGVLNPTLNYTAGSIGSLPLVFPVSQDDKANIEELCKECIRLEKEDWDSFETSWEFKKHPLMGGTCLSENYEKWSNKCLERKERIKKNEEAINSFFAEIYGLKKEINILVNEKDINIKSSNVQREVKSLISYAVGCMFGRYSLDYEGIIYAGGKWNSDMYLSFKPDADAVIPITDEEYLEDDIVSRFCEWLKVAFGEKTYEENLEFVAKNLGTKGQSSRDIIRNYFVNEFFKDHCNIYSVTGSGKRPIYWLLDSGKQNGFKALIYAHRYNVDTIGNVRIDYLHRLQRVYESEINRMQDMKDHCVNAREATNAEKRQEKLKKQLKECREYDEKIGHLALARTAISLDDGVKVNYEKCQTASDGKKYQILAKL